MCLIMTSFNITAGSIRSHRHAENLRIQVSSKYPQKNCDSLHLYQLICAKEMDCGVKFIQ